MSLAGRIMDRAFVSDYRSWKHPAVDVVTRDVHTRVIEADIADPRPQGRAPFLISRLSYELIKVRAEMRAEAFAGRAVK